MSDETVMTPQDTTVTVGTTQVTYDDAGMPTGFVGDGIIGAPVPLSSIAPGDSGTGSGAS